jgi:hypothetical protein
VRHGLMAVLLLVAACGDPTRDEAVRALGGEAAGVPRGPLHRPNQPCLLCHDEAGGKHPTFSVAGTVYARDMARKPVAQVKVKLLDTDGHHFDAVTNCAGNFFVGSDEWAPHYPLWVTMAAEGQTIDMESPVYREGSCAACHTDPKNQSSAGHVYFLVDDPDLPASHYCH